MGDSTIRIPRHEWGDFLRSFSRSHRRWLTRIETTDLGTDEQVVSRETPLESIELDLEDERNPRINITVTLDNKVVKHILFRPSELLVYASEGDREAIHIDSVNTRTTVHFRAQDRSR